jgi:transcription elongation factor Elf1
VTQLVCDVCGAPTNRVYYTDNTPLCDKHAPKPASSAVPRVTCGQCGSPDVLLAEWQGKTRGKCQNCGTRYEQVIVHGSDAELAAIVRDKLLRRVEQRPRPQCNSRYRFVKGTEVGVIVRGSTEAELLSSLLDTLLLEVEAKNG